MKITADTNLLVRAVVQDDQRQAKAAVAVLKQAELVAVPLTVLCEFVWVLRRVYAFSSQDCIAAIEALMASEQVILDGPGVRLGLQVLAAGGDFADGAIAHAGHGLGGDVLATFDRRATALLEAQGQRTLLL